MAASKGKIVRLSCIFTALAVLIVLIGLWLGGVFGISPIADEATFAQLSGHSNISAADVTEIKARVFGRSDGRTVEFTIDDKEDIDKVIGRLKSGEFVEHEGAIPPGASVNLTIKFSDKSTYAFNTNKITYQTLFGTKFFKYQDSSLDNCIIEIGESLGAFD